MKNRYLLIWLALAIPPLLWAGNFVVGRAANANVPPLMLALSRHVVALLFLLPFGWSIMCRDLSIYWEYRWKVLKVSLSGMVAFNALVYIGLHSTTASNAQLLNSTIPVLIVLIGTIVLRQRLASIQTLGLLLSCFGVLTIILRGDISFLFSLKFSSGDLIIFAAMVSFSLFSVWLRDFPVNLNRLGLLGIQFVIAVLILSPLAGGEYLSGATLEWNTSSYAAMLYVGIAAGLIANLLYMYGIARVGPARAGLFIHLVPIYGAFMSHIFLGENLYWYHALGMAGIVVGLILSQRGGQKHVSETIA
ncbi:DMT family transporter [Pectobacterium aroidearum]|uniref:DMT family transporter n=1 Tax=Pectobacterium aroidearum TaxID=1201031 RepID=UPI003307B5FE